MNTKWYPTPITPIALIIISGIRVHTDYPAPVTLHRLQNHIKMHTKARAELWNHIKMTQMEMLQHSGPTLIKHCRELVHYWHGAAQWVKVSKTLH